MLRIACGLMALTKDEVADLAGAFERENELDEALKSYVRSRDFFRDCAKIIEAAMGRLLDVKHKGTFA